MMVQFDAPDALQGLEQRQTTTVAPQALLLMNSEFVRSQSRALAGRLAKAGEKTTADAVDAGYTAALGRPPSVEEREASIKFIAEQGDAYKKDGKADAKARALADFCQVLLELNEFVYVD
jgi:hypothetical protein